MMSDFMIVMLGWVITIGLIVLAYSLVQFVINKIKERFYRKDSNGQSGEEGSTED